MFCCPIFFFKVLKIIHTLKATNFSISNIKFKLIPLHLIYSIHTYSIDVFFQIGKSCKQL